MAKTTLKSIEKDGFSYYQHGAGIDGGKTSIGFVDVLYPTSLENLAEAIEAGLETEANALACYHANKAVQLQQQARSAKAGGKIPQAAFDRIFNTLDPSFKVKWAVAVAEVNRIWRAENSA